MKTLINSCIGLVFLTRAPLRDCLHCQTIDFVSLSTAFHRCQNILSEKEQWTFLRRQEVLQSPKDQLSRVCGQLPGVRGVGQGLAASKPDMLVVAAEGLVDVEQQDKVLGLCRWGSWPAHWSS